ncbi:MAG: 5-formyltetrahydrofolate cyclo-ligase [Proteobacteria bacterium]|nr:5-formyltetrahydrofolate cyclo-ligase [Pseudomonadota bacterium]MCL2308163.1 5-formyltetrahydrofolate cyclo-ligase [Pseudomonadota bacterium]
MPDSLPFSAPLSETQRAKQEIRRRVLALRDGLSADERAAHSQRIAQRIMVLPSFLAARTVLLFHPFGSEWEATLLVQEALQNGKTVVLPRVLSNQGTSRRMVLQTIEDIARDTAPGMRGIFEPLPERPVVSPGAIDWVLVPGVAFTPRGDRLGYGGGFYDQLLPQMTARVLRHVPRHVPHIAGAFDVQIVDALPTDPHDCPMDAIYTERRVLHCARE